MILLFASNFFAPSHLWMLRMLDGLGPELVCRVVSEYPLPAEMAERYECQVLAPSLIRRGLAGTPLGQRWPMHDSRFGQLVAAIRRPEVRAVLAHFLTDAVRYQQVWSSTGKPVFIHCHGYDVTWDMVRADDPSSRFYSADYIQAVLDLPANVQFIANSHATRQKLLAIGLASERIHVKYLGIPIPEQPEPVPAEPKAITILYLGRLVDCKGPDQTIRAFEYAARRGLRGRLVLAGDGPLRAACELLRARSPYRDRIAMPGAVDEQAGERLRAEADVFTAHNCTGPVTRQEEAFGVSLLEAMAAGLPVVTGRSGGLTEIITDGVHGRLIEPGNVVEHGEALLEMERDPSARSKYAKAGWDHVQEHFSLSRQSDSLKQFFCTLVDAHPREHQYQALKFPQGNGWR